MGIYACGPTVYGRIHIGNARPFVIFTLLRRFFAHQGLSPKLVVNVTDINDKIYDAAGEAGRPSDEYAAEMTAAYIEDTDRLGLGPPGLRAARDRDDRADRGPDLGPDRGRPRLRGGGGRLLPRSQLRRLRQALQPRSRADGPGRGGRHRLAEGGPARLRALEGDQGGRGHLLGLALGQGAARVAHRVLGDGRGRARPGLRDPRRRHRPRLPASRERGRPDRGRPRRPPGPDLDAQRNGPDRRGEDVEVRGEHLPALRGAGPLRPRGRRRIPGLGPLPPAARLLRRGAAGGRRAGRGDPQLPPRCTRRGAPTSSLADQAGGSSWRRWRTTSTLRGPSPPWPRSIAEGNRRELPGARGALEELLPLLGLDSLLSGEEEADPEAERLLAEREQARAAKDFDRADAIRDQLGDLGWEVRDGADGARLVRRG